MGHLGFSAVGAVFLLALVVPNLLWTRAKPAGYDPAGESRPLQVLEGAGQAATTAAALAFSDVDLRLRSDLSGGWPPLAWSWWLVAAVALMVAYEACWVRYFASRRALDDFYRSLLGIPVPLASLPVAAFALLGVYGRLVPLVGAALVLGVGHVGIHLRHRRALAG